MDLLLLGGFEYLVQGFCEGCAQALLVCEIRISLSGVFLAESHASYIIIIIPWGTPVAVQFGLVL